MRNKTAVLLTGAAFSISAPAIAQQCGGTGSPNCYVNSTSVVITPPGGCYQWKGDGGLAYCYSYASATCTNSVNHNTYYINTHTGVGLACYDISWSAAKTEGYSGLTQLETRGNVWSGYNAFPGYQVSNYTECSGRKWQANSGTFRC